MMCRASLLGVALLVLAVATHCRAQACIESGGAQTHDSYLGFSRAVAKGVDAFDNEFGSLLGSVNDEDWAEWSAVPVKKEVERFSSSELDVSSINRCAGLGMVECGADLGLPPLCSRSHALCSAVSAAVPTSTGLSAFNATVLRARDGEGVSLGAVNVPFGAVRPIVPGGAVSVKIEPVAPEVAAVPHAVAAVMNITFVDHSTGLAISKTAADVILCFDVPPSTSAARLKLLHYDEDAKQWVPAAQPSVQYGAECSGNQVMGRARDFSSYTVVSDQFVTWWDGGNNMWIFIYIGSAILVCCCGCCVCCLCGVTQTAILALLIAFSGTITSVLSSLCCCTNICSCFNSTWIGSLCGCLIKKKKGSKNNKVADDSELGAVSNGMDYEWGDGVFDYENDNTPSMKKTREAMDVEISDF